MYLATRVFLAVKGYVFLRILDFSHLLRYIR